MSENSISQNPNLINIIDYLPTCDGYLIHVDCGDFSDYERIENEEKLISRLKELSPWDLENYRIYKSCNDELKLNKNFIRELGKYNSEKLEQLSKLEHDLTTLDYILNRCFEVNHLEIEDVKKSIQEKFNSQLKIFNELRKEMPHVNLCYKSIVWLRNNDEENYNKENENAEEKQNSIDW